MSESRLAEVNFSPVATVTVPLAGDGTGLVQGPCGYFACDTQTCTAPFFDGASALLDAYPYFANASTFAGWSGACTGVADCNITVPLSQPLTATFAVNQTPTLTILKAGNGTVTSDPPGINCGMTCSAAFPVYTRVSITALPDNPSATCSLSGDTLFYSGEELTCRLLHGCGPCDFTMDRDRTITATFVASDADGDHVADDIDQCLGTPSGEVVDSTGCSCAQKNNCDDGDPCNGVETCNPSTAACLAGEPPRCNDNNFCTADRCDPSIGCVYDPSIAQSDFDLPFNGVAVLFVPDSSLRRDEESPQTELVIEDVTKQFYCTHPPDAVQFLTLFSGFPQHGDSLAFYQYVQNTVQGLGLPVCVPRSRPSCPAPPAGLDDQCPTDSPGDCYPCFDCSPQYSPDGRPTTLEGVVNMKSVTQYALLPTDDVPRYSARSHFSTLDVLGHELAHRWGAYVRMTVTGRGSDPAALLMPDHTHWGFFTNSVASVLGGNQWASLLTKGKVVGWRSEAVTQGYGQVDLYLMGLVTAKEVSRGSLSQITGAQGCDSSAAAPECPTDVPLCTQGCLPSLGTRLLGGKRTVVDIADIQRAIGPRIPASSTTPLKQAFVYVVPATQDGQLTGSDFANIGQLHDIIAAWPTWFNDRTHGRGVIDATLQ